MLAKIIVYDCTNNVNVGRLRNLRSRLRERHFDVKGTCWGRQPKLLAVQLAVQDQVKRGLRKVKPQSLTLKLPELAAMLLIKPTVSLKT
jgi:hypothetical protein